MDSTNKPVADFTLMYLDPSATDSGAKKLTPRFATILHRLSDVLSRPWYYDPKVYPDSASAYAGAPSLNERPEIRIVDRNWSESEDASSVLASASSILDLIVMNKRNIIRAIGRSYKKGAPLIGQAIADLKDGLSLDVVFNQGIVTRILLHELCHLTDPRISDSAITLADLQKWAPKIDVSRSGFRYSADHRCKESHIKAYGDFGCRLLAYLKGRPAKDSTPKPLENAESITRFILSIYYARKRPDLDFRALDVHADGIVRKRIDS